MLTECYTCGKAKPSTEYYADRSKPRGHGTQCKSCTKLRGRARYEKDREAWIARSADNKRANPERTRAHGRAYAKRHAEQIAEYGRTYRAARPGLTAKYQRDWYTRNQGRARELGRLHAAARRASIRGNGCFVVTAIDLTRTLDRFSGRCAYCEKRLTVDMQWDHLIPVARGGTHSVGNLVPACAACNQSKSSKTVMEWRIWKRRMTVL